MFESFWFSQRDARSRNMVKSPDYCLKHNRFHFAMGLYSDNAQRTSKHGKNISTLLACGSKRTSLFLPCFDVICVLSEYSQCTAK